MVKADKMKVNSAEEGTTSGVFESAAKAGYTYTLISNNFKHVHLNAFGKHFDRIHGLAQAYYEHFSDKADFWFELAMEGLDALDNPTNATQHCEVSTLETRGYGFDDACTAFNDQLTRAIECIKELREAATDATDIQSDCDSELSYLNKEFSYFMGRRGAGNE